MAEACSGMFGHNPAAFNPTINPKTRPVPNQTERFCVCPSIALSSPVIYLGVQTCFIASYRFRPGAASGRRCEGSGYFVGIVPAPRRLAWRFGAAGAPCRAMPAELWGKGHAAIDVVVGEDSVGVNRPGANAFDDKLPVDQHLAGRASCPSTIARSRQPGRVWWPADRCDLLR